MKKFIISGLVIAGLCTSAFADNITYYGINEGDKKINSINFSDVSSQGENYWAKSAIYQITALDIMQGMASGSFSPTTKVTNEQAVTTILNSMGKAKEINELKTVSSHWSDKYIKYAMKNGLINEKTVLKLSDINGNLEAMKKKGVYVRDAAITREEVAMLVTKAFSLPTTGTEEKKPIEFVDSKQISEDKKSYVDAVSMAGIMVGSDDGMFNPKNSLTRAELAQILKNCDDYILTNLGVTKRSGFVEKANVQDVLIADEDGNDIEINVSGRNVPVLRNNMLSGVNSLKVSDEIEYYTDSSKCVKFIRVIDASIYGTDEEEQENIHIQGIVLGNSPYFYEISIKDKNGNTERYDYGSWTTIYKDGKETSAYDIIQGDTVYLEFDDLGDLVVIRGITNSVISYATIIDIDDYDVSLLFEDGIKKVHDLSKINIYKNGEEIAVSDLHKGEYAKIHSSSSNNLIKVEIVLDERTNEGIYKGYISEINKIQDRIIIRNPKKFIDGKWVSLNDGFITIPMDKSMQISYEGIILDKDELGEKQTGKFAYIATRKDTEVIERIKAINIGTRENEEILEGKISSFSEKTGLLKIRDRTVRMYVDNSTITLINDKIVSNPSFNKGDNITVIVVEEDNEYIAKLAISTEAEEERDVFAYFGKVEYINEGSEILMKINSRFEDNDWITGRERDVQFDITSETRIFNENEPLNFNEFNEKYEGKNVCVVAFGDKAVIITVTTLTETPHIVIGSIEQVDVDKFTIIDTEMYDLVEEEWIEAVNQEVITSVNTAITKNGRYARMSDIKKGQEVIVIKADELSNASVVMLKD